MKTVEIVRQLISTIPHYTNLFSDEVAITSLTRAGSTVTVTTTAEHGLVTGQQINIINAITTITITNLTIVDGQGIATTANDHDLTLGYQETVTISGAVEAGYNGTFDLVDVPNRYTFIFTIPTSPSRPATGSPKLLVNLKSGYNGLKTITVTGLTTFTYSITTTPASPAVGTIKLRKNVRISGAISIDRFIESYTKQLENKLWLTVVLGGTSAGKDRFIYSDSTYSHTNGQDFRQRISSPFSIYAFIPSTHSISGMNERDIAEDLALVIFKAVLRFQIPSGFSDTTPFGITFLRHDFYQYNYAYYIHEFVFDNNYDLTYDDTVDTDDSRAFRDVDMRLVSYFNNKEMNHMNINLDDHPVYKYGHFKLASGANLLLKTNGFLMLQQQ
jgi:hypothetical protein